MTNAGMSVSLEAEKMIDFRKDSKITVLVRKGYNGGNALRAGLLLKQKGYHLNAYLIFPSDKSPLICQEVMNMFKKFDGNIQPFDPKMISDADLIIDGLYNIRPETEHFPMSQINKAFEHLEAGKARYRIVLDADF